MSLIEENLHLCSPAHDPYLEILRKRFIPLSEDDRSVIDNYNGKLYALKMTKWNEIYHRNNNSGNVIMKNRNFIINKSIIKIKKYQELQANK